MIFEHFFEVIMGLMISVIGFFVKDVHGKINKTSEQLSDFKLHVASRYPTNENIEKRFDKIDAHLSKINDKLDEVIR